MAGTRMVAVWCPDWPVVAWGVPPTEPVAVLVANRVVATSAPARADGVAVGQRRREAQGRCPELALLDRDEGREARLFEPVVAALDAITPRIEITGPGLVGFPARGPSRFFGGDRPMADAVAECVAPVMPRIGGSRAVSRVAVADGVFTARLAARSRPRYDGGGDRRYEDGEDKGAGSGDCRPGLGRREPVIIEPGESARFLAPLSIANLDMPELTEVLVRLGIDTLGRLAALSTADVIGRFGRHGQLAHRLARGEDDHPPDLRQPAADLAVTWTFEPPAERIEQCAFVIKTLADELLNALGVRGLSCTRVAIEAETETGERHLRLWRHQGSLSSAAVADRARWQLDGWLNQAEHARPRSGIARLTIVPDEVVAATGRQLGLWGGVGHRADEVTRVVARLQAMLGADAVCVPEYRGGLTASEQVRPVPAAAVDLTEPRLAARPDWVTQPWPGRIPPPSPIKVHPDPVPVEVTDDRTRPVGVSGRGELTAAPSRLRIDSGPVRAVTAWAGPWPAEQRWWDPLTRRRRARLQVVTDDGSAHLLMVEYGQWFVEATYD